MGLFNDIAQDLRLAHTLPPEPCRSAHSYLAVQRIVNIQEERTVLLDEGAWCIHCRQALYIDWYPPSAFYTDEITIMHVRVVAGPAGQSEYYPASLLAWPVGFSVMRTAGLT